jgi:choline dehydrogenase
MGTIAVVICALLVLAKLTTSAPMPNVEPVAQNVRLGSFFGIPGMNYTFDYLVIGGGQAGLTIAARLAENPSLLIGVVEAGTFAYLSNGNLSQVPATDIYYVGKDVDNWHPGIDWGFVTTPQVVASLPIVAYTFIANHSPGCSQYLCTLSSRQMSRRQFHTELYDM